MPQDYDDSYNIPASDYRGSEEIEGEFKPFRLAEVAKPIFHLVDCAAEIAPLCESPIEIQLGARLLAELKPPFRIEPQYWFGNFRIDFAIIRDGWPCLFIECDGKAFHSSDEQVLNDLAKNRAAAIAGIPLLRLTGSEIFRQPEQCVRQIIELLGG